MVRRLVVTLVGAMALLGACGGGGESPAAPADDAQLVLGREVYGARCANCHGAAGGGGRGPRISEGRLVDKYPDVADQIALVAEGNKGMPGFAEQLSPDEIAAVVAYTREVL